MVALWCFVGFCCFGVLCACFVLGVFLGGCGFLCMFGFFVVCFGFCGEILQETLSFFKGVS